MALDRSGNLYVADFWGIGSDALAPMGSSVRSLAAVRLPWTERPTRTQTRTGPSRAMAVRRRPPGSTPARPLVRQPWHPVCGGLIQRRVRPISPDGTVTSLDTSSLPAPMWLPRYLAFDASDNLYVADGAPNALMANLIGGCRIVRVSPAGVITVLAGTGTCGFSGDGGPAAAAQLNNPNGLAFDSAGISTLPTRTTSGSGASIEVETSARWPGRAPGFSGDGGPGINAKLYDPFGIGIVVTTFTSPKAVGVACAFCNFQPASLRRQPASGARRRSRLSGRPDFPEVRHGAAE